MQTKLLGAIATTLAIASPAFAADLVIGVPNWPDRLFSSAMKLSAAFGKPR